eukprot:403364558
MNNSSNDQQPSTGIPNSQRQSQMSFRSIPQADGIDTFIHSRLLNNNPSSAFQFQQSTTQVRSNMIPGHLNSTMAGSTGMSLNFGGSSDMEPIHIQTHQQQQQQQLQNQQQFQTSSSEFIRNYQAQNAFASPSSNTQQQQQSQFTNPFLNNQQQTAQQQQQQMNQPMPQPSFSGFQHRIPVATSSMIGSAESSWGPQPGRTQFPQFSNQQPAPSQQMQNSMIPPSQFQQQPPTYQFQVPQNNHQPNQQQQMFFQNPSSGMLSFNHNPTQNDMTAASREQQRQKQKLLEQEKEFKIRMGELKKQLTYIDKSNWLFANDTVDFTQYMPFEIEKQYERSHTFSVGTAVAGGSKKL